MKSVFVQVHCGMDHGRMTDRLYDTWLARNDRMALSVVQLAKAIQQTPDSTMAGPVVVIIGAGHTDYGLGVIDRVKHLYPAVSQVNLAMTEINREPAGLDHYISPLDLEGLEPNPVADYLLFTQRVSYEDPCEKFRATFEKMKIRQLKEKPRTQRDPDGSGRSACGIGGGPGCNILVLIIDQINPADHNAGPGLYGQACACEHISFSGPKIIHPHVNGGGGYKFFLDMFR